MSYYEQNITALDRVNQLGGEEYILIPSNYEQSIIALDKINQLGLNQYMGISSTIPFHPDIAREIILVDDEVIVEANEFIVVPRRIQRTQPIRENTRHYITIPKRECIMNDERRREIIETMKENAKRAKAKEVPVRININYDYDCESDISNATAEAEKYRDNLRDAINEYASLLTNTSGKLLPTSTDLDLPSGKSVMYKENYDRKGNFVDIVSKIVTTKSDEDKFKKLKYSTLKKYSNTASNINTTKINVYFNASGSEYKVIPYVGKVPDHYHKILFTNKFEMFPLKKK